jgi:mannose-6-phosphate isomerase-like protein (cupin superfamily)
MSLAIRIFHVENDGEGIPRVKRLPDVSWMKLQDALAMPSDGHIGPICSQEPSATDPVGIMMVTCEPRGTVATHTGPQTYICYVVQGKGKLTFPGGDPLDYQPNDCIILKPGTLHGWENTNEPLSVLVVAIT